MTTTTDLIDGREACRLVGVKSPKTLLAWANCGGFPPAVRLGVKFLRWDRRAVERWLAGRRRPELPAARPQQP